MTGRNKIKYIELSKAKIQDTRSLVISEVFDDYAYKGYTMAQQVEVQEGNHNTKIFLKGAIIIDSIDELIGLRDAINYAIQNSTQYGTESSRM